MNSVSFIAGLLAYAAFLLWENKKRPRESTSKLLCFTVGLIFSSLLYYIHLIGVTIGSFLGGIIISFIPLGSLFSYILSAVCGLLLSAYTIKVLPSKISSSSFRYFKIIAIVSYSIFGLFMISQSTSMTTPELYNRASVSVVLLGISYIGVALCAACIRPSAKDSPAAPKASPSPTQISLPTKAPSAGTSDQNDPPAVKNASDSAVPSCAPAAQPQKDSAASPKAVIHFSISKKVLLAVAFVVVLLVGVLVGLLLGEGYFAPNFIPSSPYIDSLKDSVEDAHSEGYQKGYFAGKDVGKQSWYADGYNAGLSDGYGAGYSDGYEDGYNEGYDDGYYTY